MLFPRRPSPREYSRLSYPERGRCPSHSDFSQEELSARTRGAVVIQKAFRRTKLMYQVFGPMLFHRPSGASTDFGRISFSGQQAGAMSHFITISDTTSIDLVSNFVAFHWKLERPEVLISITGGARDFDLKPQLLRVLGQGLVDVVRVSKAWLVTGGTDTGVMKMVGDVIWKHSIKLPLIGIVSYGCVNGRAELGGCSGSTVQLPMSKPSARGSPLNPNHNYFILVDNGSEAPKAWGSEIPFRSKFEAQYRVVKHVPSVLLVVQGGVGTLSTILTAARVGTPIVLLAESGGAASAVYKYIERDAHIEDGFELFEESLQELYDLQLASDWQLFLFVFSDGQKADLSSALLQAIVNTFKTADKSASGAGGSRRISQSDLSDRCSSLLSPLVGPKRDGLAGALQLSIQWDRFDVFLTIAEQMQRIGKGSDSARRRRLAWGRALQRALELQRPSMVAYLLSLPDCRLEGLQLARLYTVKDKYGLFRSDGELARIIQEHLHMIHDDKRGASIELYHTVVQPLFDSLSPLLASMMCSSDKPQMNDLFLWATLVGNRAIALELWGRLRHPLRMALLASSACSEAAARINWGHHDMMALAEELEGWATGVLDAVPQPDVAHSMLARVIPGVSPHSLTNIALHTQKKAFIAHRYVQSQLDLIWRGEESQGGTSPNRDAIPENFSYFFLAIRSFLPGCIFARQTSRQEEVAYTDEYGFKRDDRVSQAMIFDAMATSLNIARKERSASFRHAGVDGGVEGSGDVVREEGNFPAIAKVARDVVSKFEIGPRPREAKVAKPTESVSIGFYRIPAVKFAIRGSLHVVQLVLYACVLSATLNPRQLEALPTGVVMGLTPFELAFFLLTTSLALDELHQWMGRHKAGLQKLQHGLDNILNLSDVAILCAVALRFASILQHSDENLHRKLYVSYQLVLSFNVIFTSLRLVPYLSVKKQFGVLVIIVEEMFDDLAQFLRLFIIVVGGFQLAVTGLSEGDVQAWSSPGRFAEVGGGMEEVVAAIPVRYASDVEVALHWYDSQSAFMLPLWCIFGAVDADVIEERLPVFSLLMAFYMLIASIVMVNLLVAMFSETYSRIKTRAELEYLFQKSFRIHHHMNVTHRYAPVLNAPFVICELLSEFFIFCRWSEASPSEGDPEMNADDAETDVNESTYYVDRFLVEKNEAEKAKLDTLAASTNSVVCQLSKDVKELALSSKSSLSELSSGMAALCEKGNMKLSRESSRLVRTSGSATGAISAPETPPERNVRQDTLARCAEESAREAVATLERAFSRSHYSGCDERSGSCSQASPRTPVPIDTALHAANFDSIKKRIAELQQASDQLSSKRSS